MMCAGPSLPTGGGSCWGPRGAVDDVCWFQCFLLGRKPPTLHALLSPRHRVIIPNPPPTQHHQEQSCLVCEWLEVVPEPLL